MNNPQAVQSTIKADRLTQAGIATFLIVSILIAYYQIFHFGFIAYDTAAYVTENTKVHAGITLDNVKWAFTTNFFANWHPLTWLSYMLDMELWGLNPTGFHVTNLFFHICNSLLLFGILQKLTSKTWESAFVAGLFALHPMHIESVAWVAERKDMLSTFFFLLAIASYVNYLQRQNLLRYGVILLTFFLGLMSKGMVVTLPAVLLLLDYWPLRRYGFSQQHDHLGKKPVIIVNDSHLSIILEKIPIVILAAFGAGMTILTQQGNLIPLERLPFSTRLATAFTGYLAYIEKTFWPINLAALYPLPGMPPLSETMLAVLVLLIISLLALQWRHSRPWFIIGWLWFLGTLVPVLGLIHVGHQFIADRYTYIPHIGFFIILAWGLSELSNMVFTRNKIFTAVAFTLLMASGIQTWHQLHYWKNDRTLWTRAVEITHDNYIAENNLGSALLQDNLPDEAKKHFICAIQINSRFDTAYFNLGSALANEGKLNEAIQNYQMALSLNPNLFLSQYQIARAYRQNKMSKEAITHFQNALILNPKLGDAYVQLGELYIENKQTNEALEIYKSLKKINPQDKEIPKKISALEKMLKQIKQNQP
ncbi:MAG: tetratricopeptide repeat protein [Proteobacteria bacterium]|nr:tetratricopeptide repeat protein [Pseudomonadota bacterium]MBU1648812.1 tetratricopeptide repeat protein [Pseudomonadota bacterium]